ncbi:MAG: hypothetical protein AAFY34_06300 [Pseudomonadota bacterium]
MRDLFDQGRAMSPGLIRSGTGMLGALLGVAGVIVLLQGLGNILSFSAPLTGIVQISGGFGILLAVYLIVRLLSEVVLALHRLNDRLTVLSADLSATRAAGAAPAEPVKPDPKPVRRTRAKTAAKPTEDKPAKSTSAAEA